MKTPILNFPAFSPDMYILVLFLNSGYESSLDYFCYFSPAVVKGLL